MVRKLVEKHREKILEFMRFCIVGVIASALHYGIYYLLRIHVNINLAYATGYLISLVCNFFLTTYLTFRSLPTLRRAVGFCLSHGVNFLIHIILLNIFIGAGISDKLAPILVMAVAMVINFLLLRTVYNHK